MIGYEKLDALEPSTDQSHHIGSPPSAFRNPWPSFPSLHAGLKSVLKARFFDKRPPFVPVPADRSELVPIVKPDFNVPPAFTGFRVTWIGHASFLVQCCSPDLRRPIGILLDPVFAERTSPVTFIGPKRYTETPCSLLELLDAVPVDVVCVSHNHYDHADTTALKSIHEHRTACGQNVVFCVALGNPRWLLPLGISSENVWEAEWWNRIEMSLSQDSSTAESAGVSSPSSAMNHEMNGTPSSPASSARATVRITCTPSQHTSARSPFDRDRDLWCGWAFDFGSDSAKITTVDALANPVASSQPSQRKSLFFAGDTGYRTVTSPTTSDEELKPLPACPAFRLIGKHLGPFDLALLPIGLCRPRHFMSSVHCNSVDSMDIHFDVRSKKSVGMHWGTVRGGISAYYEDVRDPPLEWQAEARKRNMKWRGDQPKAGEGHTDDEEGWEAGLMSIGESLLI